MCPNPPKFHAAPRLPRGPRLKKKKMVGPAWWVKSRFVGRGQLPGRVSAPRALELLPGRLTRAGRCVGPKKKLASKNKALPAHSVKRRGWARLPAAALGGAWSAQRAGRAARRAACGSRTCAAPQGLFSCLRVHLLNFLSLRRLRYLCFRELSYMSHIGP